MGRRTIAPRTLARTKRDVVIRYDAGTLSDGAGQATIASVIAIALQQSQQLRNAPALRNHQIVILLESAQTLLPVIVVDAAQSRGPLRVAHVLNQALDVPKLGIGEAGWQQAAGVWSLWLLFGTRYFLPVIVVTGHPPRAGRSIGAAGRSAPYPLRDAQGVPRPPLVRQCPEGD